MNTFSKHNFVQKMLLILFLMALPIMHPVDVFADVAGWNPGKIADDECDGEAICSAIVESVLSVVSGFINEVVCPIIDGLTFLVNETVGKIAQIATILSDKIPEFVAGAADFVQRTPQILASLGGMIADFTAKAPETLATLGETITTLASNAPQALSTVGEQISTVATKGPEVIGLVADQAATLAEKGPETLGTVADMAGEFAQKAPETIEKLDQTANLFGEASLSTLESLTELSTSTFPSLVEESFDIVSTFSEKLDELFEDNLFEDLTELVDNSTDMFETFSEGFDEKVLNLSDFLESDGFGGINTQITGFGENLLGQLDIESLTTLLSDIKEGLPEVAELRVALQEGVGEAVAAIPDVIEGIQEIDATIQRLRVTVANLATDPEKVTSILDSLLSLAVETSALASPTGLLAQQERFLIQLEATEIFLDQLPAIIEGLPTVLAQIDNFDSAGATSLIQGIPAQLDGIPDKVQGIVDGFVKNVSADITVLLNLVPAPQLDTFKAVLALSATAQPTHIAAEKTHSEEILTLLNDVNAFSMDESMMAVATNLQTSNQQLRAQLTALEQELHTLKTQTLSERDELDALRSQNRILLESLTIIKEKLISDQQGGVQR